MSEQWKTKQQQAILESDKWTAEQKQAILQVDTDLIVTAGAGSGKTTTMIERALGLVLAGTSVENIVMLTFTEAAAKEMKEKLRARLIVAAKESTDPCRRNYLVEQLDALPYASISTIHAYCAALIREYFEQIPLSPNLRVLEEDACDDLMNKAFEQLLKEKEGDVDFDNLRFNIGLRDDKDLFDLIKKLYEFMTNQPDREQWLEGMRENTYPTPLAGESRAQTFERSTIARWFAAYIAESAKSVVQACDRCILLAENAPDNSKASFELLKMRAHAYENVHSVQQIFWAHEEVQTITGNVGKSGLMFEADIVRVQDNYNNLLVKPIAGMMALGTYDELVDMHLNSAGFVRALGDLALRLQTLFTREKAEMGGVDYADLERYALAILHNETIAAEVKARNHYVFVDEFQDTNDVQYAIIGLITPPDRLFMVGDSKQCIYRFRAAEPRIFLSTLGALQQEGKSVGFSRNFRSDNGILHYVNKVFNVLMTPAFGGVDYQNADRFIPREGNVDSGTAAVSVYLYNASEREDEEEEQAVEVAKGTYSVRAADMAVVDDSRAEGLAIVQYINSLYGQTVTVGKEQRTLSYKDFAILVSKRRSIQRLLPTLQRLGLPLNLDKLAGDVGLRDVRVLLAYADLMDNGMQDYPLLTVMRSPLGGFDDADLAEIRMIADSGYEQFWHVVDRYRTLDTLLAARVGAFLNMVSRHRFAASFTPIGTLLKDVMLTTGYTDYLLAAEDGLARIAAVEQFLTSLSGKAYAANLSDLCAHFRAFPLDKLDSVSTGADDRVIVNTMHGSKGLEYPVVILPGLGDKVDVDKSKVKLDKYLGIGTDYYNDGTHERRTTFAQYVIGFQQALFNREDRLRLFYVAMTRAQSRLLLCGGVPKNVSYTPGTEAKFSKWLQYAEKMDDTLAAYRWTPPEGEVHAAKEEERKLQLDDALDAVLASTYGYADAVDVRKKYTVTAINASHNEESLALPSFLPGPDEKEYTGTLYHTVFQHIDYNATDAKAVAEDMSRLVAERVLTPDEAALVDVQKVAACLRLPLLQRTLQEDVRTYHEQRFVMEASAKDLQLQADESVLVQGVIDLLMVSEKDVTVIDFKLSNRLPRLLKDAYSVQLAMYSRAVSRALGRPVTQCYLVEINRAEVIPMDVD